MIVDVLRAHQLVMDGSSFGGLVDKVIFMGHSLGGACSIIAAAKVQVSSVAGDPKPYTLPTLGTPSWVGRKMKKHSSRIGSLLCSVHSPGTDLF